MHKPIKIKDLSISFAGKICFEDFSTTVYPGARIGIVGRNGSGKSFLLNALLNIAGFKQAVYVSQIHELGESLSGSQYFNKKLSSALSGNPEILLLDEPTNHLDIDNRRALTRMLQNFHGTLLIASHDEKFLNETVDALWYINNYSIEVFHGTYQQMRHDYNQKRLAVETQMSELRQSKKSLHLKAMKEQARAAKSKKKGIKSIKNRKWPTVTSKAKANKASMTAGLKKSAINRKAELLKESLSDLYLPEVIVPTFSMNVHNHLNTSILSIQNGSVGYTHSKDILNNIALHISAADRVALLGKNASGKSTFLNAVLGSSNVKKSGEWDSVSLQEIGYLDQNYSLLDDELTVFATIKSHCIDWDDKQIREHLSTFLFRKNYDINNKCKNLSGGERARLGLALIAIKPIKLLILDEVTNNIDLEIKEHVIQVLQNFPAALLVVSHDEIFLQQLNIDRWYEINYKQLLEKSCVT